MKKRIISWLIDYSYRITTYIFWAYFLFIIVLDVFNVKLGKITTLVFWFLLGFYLGYTVSLQILKYKREKRNYYSGK